MSITFLTNKDKEELVTNIGKLSEEKADKKDIPESYTLPVATADRLGGMMVGDGLNVDENGRVSMKQADKPMRLIREIITTEAVGSINIDTDNNGNPFGVKNAYVEFEVPNAKTNTFIMYINSHPAINTDANTYKSTNRKLSAVFEIKNGRCFCTERGVKASAGGYGQDCDVMLYGHVCGMSDMDNINKVMMMCISESFDVGTRLAVYEMGVY